MYLVYSSRNMVTLPCFLIWKKSSFYKSWKPQWHGDVLMGWGETKHRKSANPQAYGEDRLRAWLPYMFCIFKSLGIKLNRSIKAVVLVVKNPPANAGDKRDAGSIPELGRSSKGGNGNPLQYPYLENPTVREAWRATVHTVTRSQTQLKWLGMPGLLTVVASLVQTLWHAGFGSCSLKAPEHRLSSWSSGA